MNLNHCNFLFDTYMIYDLDFMTFMDVDVFLKTSMTTGKLSDCGTILIFCSSHMIFSKIDHCVYCVCVHAQRQCNKSKLVSTEMPHEGGRGHCVLK